MTQWDFLKKSAELGKLSHAYLFFGNNGDEKQKTLSRLLEFLQCDTADIVRVAPENEITIAQIRELSLKLSLAPWASPFQIAIIEGAETMNQEAQSALLKLLEEPKGGAIFFLLTEYQFLLLPTIRSRTQQVGFWEFANEQKPISEEFEKLRLQSLAKRFEYAKNIAESEQDPREVLKELLRSLRASMLQSLKGNPQKAASQARALELVQETIFLLQTTNVSPRLALEQVLLEL